MKDPNQIGDEFNYLDPFYSYYSLESHWQPFFSDRMDFNTNANSYYEYLAHLNHILKAFVNLLNRVARRNLSTKNTNSVELIKLGDWIAGSFVDTIQLSANVKLSTRTERYTNQLSSVELELTNAIKLLEDGLYAKDFEPVLNEVFKQLRDLKESISNLRNELLNKINELEAKDRELVGEIAKLKSNIQDLNGKYQDLTNKNQALESALKKILANLHSTGAINSQDLNFEFNSDRSIATGNINLFSNGTDSKWFIRTSNSYKEYDIAAGV